MIFLDLEVYSEDDYHGLPRRDRYVWDVSWFDTEVRNGGLRQYFINSAGDHWRGALEALREIGEEPAASMLQEACALFPDGLPAEDQESREEQLRPIWDVLRELDDRLESYWESDVFEGLLAYWIQADPGSGGAGTAGPGV